MNKELTWREIKALNDLYTAGFTSARIQHHPYILYLKNDLSLLSNKFANKKVLEKEKGFDKFYKKNHWGNYLHYFKFLSDNKILNDCSRYEEDDIQVLILVDENKKEIIKSLTTQRSFSCSFFKNKGSKHLEAHPSLENALLKILDIQGFPDKDPKNNQYRYVVDCKTKKTIVLCENLNFLKMPWKARENNIELWYVGGNNVSKLDHITINEINVPIFYSCDWDYDGLVIFQRIRGYIPSIKLLLPSSKNTKPCASKNHYSSWKKEIELSGLDPTCFDKKSIELIKQLIITDGWIEEESNDLLELLTQNGC